MLPTGKDVVFKAGFLQSFAKYLALSAQKFLGEFFLSKFVFGYFKTKKSLSGRTTKR